MCARVILRLSLSAVLRGPSGLRPDLENIRHQFPPSVFSVIQIKTGQEAVMLTLIGVRLAYLACQQESKCRTFQNYPSLLP